MAFKCIRTCYPGRLFEEGEIYDSIGNAQERFFEEIEVADDNAQLVKTGLPDNREAPRQELDDLGVVYSERLELKELQALLDEAKTDALGQ